MKQLQFFQVLVASPHYHGQTALTYHTDLDNQPLTAGRIVRLPLRDESALGIISKPVKRPSFTTKAIDEILDLPPLPKPCLELITWLQNYYPAPLGLIIQQFLPKSLSNKYNTSEPVFSKPTCHLLPPLTSEQKIALGKITGAASYLLHGETGSGKTRVYQELARQSIKRGQSVLMLTPEISLVAQLYQNFQAIFGQRVLLMHSDMTDLQRRQTWLCSLTANQPLIIIGARSALFSPLANIGLIMIDEAHEPAYKQEQAPRYHALRVAAQLRQLHHAQLVFGSATPSVSDYYIAQKKALPIIRMQQLAASKTVLPGTAVKIIDLKDRTQFNRSPHFSDQLISAMETALNNQEQSLLFLNRRGSARLVVCSTCGWQALCPHCDTLLTYHGDDHRLRCHTCSFSERSPSACPTCSNVNITYKTVGTKALVEEVHRILPQARINRYDTDNKKSEQLFSHYTKIREGTVDVLVGTQSLAKGLDLPHLAVVGVISADTNLAMPDYTAEERMYQLITQVIGRIGRGHRKGRAIIQSYRPDSPVLQAAITKNWPAFYEAQLAERRQFRFPPFCYLLRLSCRRRTAKAAEAAAHKMLLAIKQQNLPVELNGPAPAFHEKVSNYFQWHIIIKAAHRTALTQIISNLPSNWAYDIDPTNLL